LNLTSGSAFRADTTVAERIISGLVPTTYAIPVFRFLEELKLLPSTSTPE